MGEPERSRAPESQAPPEPPCGSSRRPKRRSGGVAVVAGGLLQDLEERLRRDLAPVEERVRPGEELRGLAGGRGSGSGEPVVIVLPGSPAGPETVEPDAAE